MLKFFKCRDEDEGELMETQKMGGSFLAMNIIKKGKTYM